VGEGYLERVSAERIGAHIRALEGVRHPVAAPEALAAAADYVYRSLDALDYQVEAQVFQAGGKGFRNVIATRTGARHPEEQLLVVAHYDTVEDSPGADDNASGVAVLLELARVLEPFAFERTVHFAAVALEEDQQQGPLAGGNKYGSRALAARAAQQAWQVDGAIVLESVAYAGEEMAQETPEGLPVTLPEVGNFVTVVGNEASQGLVERFVYAIARHGIALPAVPLVVPGKGERFPETRRSDHAPFWDAGFRAVMLTDTANFRNPHYHQPTDTSDTLNLDFAANVCRAVGGVVVGEG
jgi:Zn-dependent M28 family amino/carboxypeptidase